MLPPIQSGIPLPDRKHKKNERLEYIAKFKKGDSAVFEHESSQTGWRSRDLAEQRPADLPCKQGYAAYMHVMGATGH